MIKETICLGLLISYCTVNSELIMKGLKSNYQPDWWQTTIIYQVYMRSFKDSDGDGIGDLNGLAQKVDYFKNIGVGAIWLSPIFQSQQLDFGYDISNYKEIDTTFGTIVDFDRLLDEFHKAGIKIILDFVPNHTSDEHEWFIKSVKKIPPFTDFYVWKDPVYKDGKRQPPNNWLSVFNSGSAWEWNEQRQQYYLHQFLVKQPDLNYRCPTVVEEIKNTILFWLGRGVDGFRFDATNYLFEREDLADEPKSGKPDYEDTDYDSLSHISTLDQPETYEMVRVWREMLDKYTVSKDHRTRFIMVECYSPFDKTLLYYGNKSAPGAHFPFNFQLIGKFNHQSNAYDLRDVVVSWIREMPEGMWPNWVLGNHDNSRIASRLDPMLVDGLHMIQMLLPGTAVTYYADELGVEDTYVRWDQTIDTAGLNVGPRRYEKFSRDPARSPFPWDDTKNAGFSSGSSVWLPINPRYWRDNMMQQNKFKSHLKTYKQLARLRQSPTFVRGDLHLYVFSNWVFGFSRSYYDHPTYFVIINLGSEMENINLLSARDTLPDIMKVKISSINSGYVTGNLLNSEYIAMRPKTAIVLTTSRNNEDSY